MLRADRDHEISKLSQIFFVLKQPVLRFPIPAPSEMAKEKSTDPEKEAKKLAKAEKKAKRSEVDGVHKSKSDKKEKKEKKIVPAGSDADVTTKLLNTIEETKPGSVVVKEQDGDVKVKVKTEPLLGALVPFANPLADEKTGKKVLKSVKKGSPIFI